ncbi:GGDEF domain-containing response regulator [Bacillus sp. USDA818B3_A]|uniref:GGDEF domain-containing response regulator n=1 Tax=Bacillus sp. USDA818B3_A TaxID=2698834 RepID=UPI00136DCC54|nr:response regulator [Bacillus sp. USDA818B3_A]
MDLNKYKNLLIQKLKNQLSKWFNSDEAISHSEVYDFLHSLHGSAGTLQLGGLHQLSGLLMNQISPEEDGAWEKASLQKFLKELINLIEEYDTFIEREAEKHTGRRLDETVPLIQIIDQDVSMLILLKEALEEVGWMTVVNTDSKKAVSQYFDLTPDCVIMDCNLPAVDGGSIFETIEQHSRQHFVPRIIVSLLNDGETRMKAYKLGADAFIEKPIDLEELIVRISHHLKRKNLLNQLTLVDPLTQLYNRKFLLDVYNRNLKDLKRHKHPFSIAILDLDHFKQMNAAFGHTFGEKILTAFASFLKEHTRSYDTIFRYGGDKFIILFENAYQVEVAEIVSRLLAKFSAIPFHHEEQISYVTFSAGIYTIHHDDITMDSAIMAAEQALRSAKTNGRARVENANNSKVELPKSKLFVSIIDDDPIIRTMLLRILNTMDFSKFDLNLAEFGDGVEFFHSNRLEEKGEHFLIIDGVMPVMDGIEVLQRVQKIKYSHNIHVLMLTGRKGEADIEKALALGADDYVTKPFSIKELQARIQRLIKRMK